MTNGTAIIKQSVFMPATPEEVYEAYTNPELHSEFTGAKATGTPEVGEAFTAWDGYIEGQYVELDPGKRVVQTWSTSEWPEHAAPSTLELTFDEKDGGTNITLVQTDVPSEQSDDYDEGWHSSYWEPMKAYFEAKQN